MSNTSQPLPPNNRTSIASSYSGNIDIPSTGGDPVGAQLVCRASYLVPGPRTIYSEAPYVRVDGLGDAANGYSFLIPRLVVTWGDAGQTFTRDMPANRPITVCGSFVEVKAYLALHSLPSDAYPPTSPNDARIRCKVRALIVEGTQDDRAAVDTTSGGKHAGDLEHVAGSGNPGPFTLYGLWGMQTSGTDLFLMLFDRNSDDIDGLQNPADGDWPTMTIPAPSGVAFSLADDAGIAFQNGFVYRWSTTIAKLTTYGGPSPLTPPEYCMTVRTAAACNTVVGADRS